MLKKKEDLSLVVGVRSLPYPTIDLVKAVDGPLDFYKPPAYPLLPLSLLSSAALSMAVREARLLNPLPAMQEV